MLFHTIDQVRRFFKILGGFTLLGLGAVMLFTPGPGWVVIFLGLTLLAAEFVWAKRLMDRMKEQGTRIKDSVLRMGKSDSADSA
ncbi:MAG TPA: PGPGW domain-containing protein [Terriglobales bacterium]|nr:PGPGW domain-containing protein [Terriglobales bacterium]